MTKLQNAKNQRQCLVTREILAKDDLMRFVANPEGCVVYDVNHKLPGKGMWVKADKEVLLKALKNNSFKQADKKLKIDNLDIESIAITLKNYLLGLLSMMNKAGLLYFGQERIGVLLDKDEVFAIIITKDCSQNSKNKLQSHIKKNIPIVDGFENADINNVFPTEKISFIGLGAGKMVEKFISQFTIYNKLVSE